MYPRNPDQMRWAVLTCLDVHKPNDTVLFESWKNFDLPNDIHTHCFVKCVLMHSRIYPIHWARVNKTAVEDQFKGRGIEVPTGVQDLEKIIAGTCKDIYDEVINVFKNNLEAFKKAFYFYEDDIREWYNQNPDVARPFGADLREYCKKKNKDDEKCELDCRFYYYRLVDEDKKIYWGRFLQTPGIKMDEHSKCLFKAKTAKECDVAVTLDQCLREKNQTAWEQMQKNLDEITNKDYDYGNSLEAPERNFISSIERCLMLDPDEALHIPVS
ncbi:hypothetical protein DMENIID0001_088710 [Sergentomyia squamirostris]